MDISELLVSGAINATFLAIVTYVIFRTSYKQAKSELKLEIESWLNSEQGQKALFQIGGIIAGGAKSSFQLPTARGKGGIEGLVTGLISNFIERKIGGQPQPSNTQYEQ